MLEAKELKRHRELSDVNSYIDEIQRVYAQQWKTAHELCDTLIRVLDEWRFVWYQDQRPIEPVETEWYEEETPYEEAFLFI